MYIDLLMHRNASFLFRINTEINKLSLVFYYSNIYVVIFFYLLLYTYYFKQC